MADRDLSRRAVLTRALSATAVATIVAAPAIVEAVAMPVDPAERVKRAWLEFCAAMQDVVPGSDGWIIGGAGHRWTKLHPSDNAEPFLNLRSVHYVQETITRGGVQTTLPVERHRLIPSLADPRDI